MAAPYRIVVWQLLATAAIAVALLVWELATASRSGAWLGLSQTVSALAAGVACVVPAGWYAWRAARERSGAGFVLQWAVKFALTIALMALGIILIRPAPAGYFGTLIVLQGLYVLVPMTAGSARKATP